MRDVRGVGACWGGRGQEVSKEGLKSDNRNWAPNQSGVGRGFTGGARVGGTVAPGSGESEGRGTER